MHLLANVDGRIEADSEVDSIAGTRIHAKLFRRGSDPLTARRGRIVHPRVVRVGNELRDLHLCHLPPRETDGQRERQVEQYLYAARGE